MTSQVCNVSHSQIHSDQPTFQLISRSNLVIIKSLPFRTTTMSSHWMSLKTWPIDDREAPRLWWSNFNSQIPWFGSICLPISKGFVCSRGMGLLLSLMIYFRCKKYSVRCARIYQYNLVVTELWNVELSIWKNKERKLQAGCVFIQNSW